MPPFVRKPSFLAIEQTGYLFRSRICGRTDVTVDTKYPGAIADKTLQQDAQGLKRGYNRTETAPENTLTRANTGDIQV